VQGGSDGVHREEEAGDIVHAAGPPVMKCQLLCIITDYREWSQRDGLHMFMDRGVAEGSWSNNVGIWNLASSHHITNNW